MLENNVLPCHYVLLFIVKLNQLIFGTIHYEPDFSLWQQFIYCTCKRGSPHIHMLIWLASSETYCSVLFWPLGTNCRTNAELMTFD